MSWKRRSLLSGLVAGVIGSAGATSVSGSEATEYVVNGSEESKRAVRGAGYSVKTEITDEIYTVTSSDAHRDLVELDGVSSATPNLTLEATTVDEEPASVTSESDGEQWDKERTDAFDAHEYATGDGARIAIVDTGIDHTHPDLENVNTDDSASIIDGEVSEHRGDVGYHGTHVAGVAGATGRRDVTGMAPEAELISLRIFGSGGGGSFEDMLLAVSYATELGVDVVNLSIESTPLPSAESRDGIRGSFNSVCRTAARNGTLIVASVGNDGARIRSGEFVLPSSSAGVISVSATGPDDTRAYYSNYGTSDVDVAAPGGGRATEAETTNDDLVLSTGPGGSMRDSGTSVASAQVAGLAALLRELESDANTERISTAIERGAERTTGRSDPELGAGRINALDAIDRL